jgi:serine/threonine protein phosphatase PrpC
MNYQAFSATAAGSGHEKQAKGCEDFSSHYTGALSGKERLAVAVVADGHGAEECFRSARGAAFAVEIAESALRDFARELGAFEHKTPPMPGIFTKIWGNSDLPAREEFDGLARNLIKHIAARWHTEVEAHYNAHPFSPEELEKISEKYRVQYQAGNEYYKAYGTTLIACAVSARYWIALHIGDGRFTVLEQDGSYNQPVPWDSRCFLNLTSSLCDRDAVERGRFQVSLHAKKAPPAAFFLCTDGIDDNYPVEENDKHLFKLFRTIALTFAKDGFDSTCAQIKDLVRSFASKGKGDDTSLALIIDMESAAKTARIWQKQIEREEGKQPEKKEARRVQERAPQGYKEFDYGVFEKISVESHEYKQRIIRGPDAKE